jgi:hypothetical protein
MDLFALAKAGTLARDLVYWGRHQAGAFSE